MIDLWRRATPDQKLARMFGMGHMINELARGETRQRYPNATPREIDLRVASRAFDRKTMLDAFGWDPDIQGR
jgi:hypothetical protein